MNDLGKLFLQIVYDCNPQDKEHLEELQRKIQERINFLTEQNQDTFADATLLEYYELHSKIQQCISQDHSDQYLVIAAVISALAILVFLRWKMITRKKE